MISVTFSDWGDNQITLPSRLTYTPTHYSDKATGGSDTAEIEVTGVLSDLWLLFGLLGYRVILTTDDGTVVWHGLVEEIFVESGILRRGLSLKKMANRLKVAYTVEDIDGNVERQTTAWSENALSVSRYGSKEDILSLSDTIATTATQYRDTQLAQRGTPIKIFDLNGNDRQAATLYCTGLINTLAWVHYEQAAGYIAHDTGSTASQVIGVGTTSTRIGFSKDGKIHHLDGGMEVLQVDARIQVAGSASNNGAHLVESTDSRDPVTYTTGTIFFDVSDDVNDSNNGLSILDNNDYIQISGAANGANNGIKLVTSTGAGHITVSPSTIVNEVAGASASKTIVRGTFARTATEFVEEFPSNNTTVTVHGAQIMQTFVVPSNTAWTVNEISLRVRKYNSPADGLILTLATVSNNQPGTTLESVTLPASDISAVTHTWRTWTFANTTVLSPGVTYCIVVSRSSSNSLSSYYSVEVDTGVGYTSGDYRVYTGSSWTDPYVDASLYFRIESAQETTTQIQNIANRCGQFLSVADANSDIVNASGVETPQFREGDLDGLTELEKLLDIGTSDDRRLLATVTPNRRLRIYRKPDAATTDNILNNDGSIVTATNTKMPEGKLIAGTWLRTRDVPASVGALTTLESLFIESSERSGDGVLRPRAEEQEAVWDL